MTHRTSKLLRLCLAGSALATAAAFSPAQAGVSGPAYTKADAIGTVAPSQKVSFELYLPLRNKAQLDVLLARMQQRGSADYHKWLTPAQFAAQFGPDKSTIASLSRELAAQGFVVQARSRSLHLTGTADAVRRAFGTQLSLVRGQAGQSRMVALGGLKLSATLTSAGARVLAFSPRRFEAHTMVAKATGPLPASSASPDNRYGGNGPYWYNDLRQAYGYPAYNATATAFDGTVKPLTGVGASIATLISSDVLDSDIHLMFEHEHFRINGSSPLPALAGRRFVDGAVPGVLTDASFEAALDVQQLIGGAPGADVILYDIPDLSNDAVAAGYTAINENNDVDVVSSSFGLCDKYYSPAYNSGIDYTYILDIEHELFMQGNSQGITFLASSGDEAGRECISVDYFYGASKAVWIPGASTPSTDPNVTSVGGTNLQTTFRQTSLASKYKSENAYADPRIPVDFYGFGTVVSNFWWGAGGGPSLQFSKPDYQNAVNTSSTQRVTPDVGMQVGGCPGGSKLPCDGGNLAVNGNGNRQRSYVLTYVEGGLYGLIGTSVSSPEFASALALMVELHGRQGNVNPYLYSLAGTDAYHLGIPGYNAVHPNTFPDPNYNYTVGLGTPYVARLIGLPADTPLAGTPRSPSNP